MNNSLENVYNNPESLENVSHDPESLKTIYKIDDFLTCVKTINKDIEKYKNFLKKIPSNNDITDINNMYDNIKDTL